MDQINIFEELYKKLPIWNKPLSIIEMYGGIGSQLKALKNIGVNVKNHTLVEVDIDATISYAAIHCGLNEKLKTYEFPTKEEIIKHLYPFNWWSNEKPKDIKKLKISKLQKLFLAQSLTNNLGDVFQLQGKDLPNVDLITWSTPCQDFSIAGKQSGFSGNKGGLTFVTLNLFKELKELNKSPTFLLFENVPAIMSKTFIHGFNVMRKNLRDLGYENLTLRLNAKNFGIPQNRDRVFILSIKKEYLDGFRYDIPKEKELKLRLKDMLESNVDEKFYLSDKQISQISSWNSQQNPIENAKTKDDKTLQCITAKSNTSMNASMLLIKETTNIDIYDFSSSENFIGDKSRIKKNVEIFDTILTNPKKGIIVKGNYMPSNHNASRIVDDEGIAPTVMENHGTVTAIVEKKIIYDKPLKRKGWHHKAKEVLNTEGITTCLTTQSNNLLQKIKEPNNLRIRKLTPKECWRLMGFDDIDVDNASQHISNSALYKQAGNSIVIDVLEAIFKNLFSI